MSGRGLCVSLRGADGRGWRGIEGMLWGECWVKKHRFNPINPK
jgi:hypothetical protein